MSLTVPALIGGGLLALIGAAVIYARVRKSRQMVPVVARVRLNPSHECCGCGDELIVHAMAPAGFDDCGSVSMSCCGPDFSELAVVPEATAVRDKSGTPEDQPASQPGGEYAVGESGGPAGDRGGCCGGRCDSSGKGQGGL